MSLFHEGHECIETTRNSIRTKTSERSCFTHTFASQGVNLCENNVLQTKTNVAHLANHIADVGMLTGQSEVEAKARVRRQAK